MGNALLVVEVGLVFAIRYDDRSHWERNIKVGVMFYSELNTFGVERYTDIGTLVGDVAQWPIIKSAKPSPLMSPAAQAA